MFAVETWNSLILSKDSNSNFSIHPTSFKRCLIRAFAPFIIAYWGVAATLLQVQSKYLTVHIWMCITDFSVCIGLYRFLAIHKNQWKLNRSEKYVKRPSDKSLEAGWLCTTAHCP